jgi:hypothetical protein
MTKRGQVLLEYFLLVGLVAFIVLLAFRPNSTVLKDTLTAANEYYKTGTRAILGSRLAGDTLVTENPLPINGGWCGLSAKINGVQVRECACPRPAFGGKECEGPAVLGTTFSGWGPCSKNCGGGVQKRYIGDPYGVETRSCNTAPCAQDCTWSDWSDWSECPVNCGGVNPDGTKAQKHRTRHKVYAPVDAMAGKVCDGGAVESAVCEARPCPIAGQWSDYVCDSCELPGSVAKQLFLDAGLDANTVFQALIDGGYIDATGFILAKFRALTAASQLVLPAALASARDKIYGIMKQALQHYQCGDGGATCTRVCNNPPPSNGGAYCAGENSYRKGCMATCAPQSECVDHLCLPSCTQVVASSSFSMSGGWNGGQYFRFEVLNESAHYPVCTLVQRQITVDIQPNSLGLIGHVYLDGVGWDDYILVSVNGRPVDAEPLKGAPRLLVTGQQVDLGAASLFPCGVRTVPHQHFSSNSRTEITSLLHEGSNVIEVKTAITGDSEDTWVQLLFEGAFCYTSG